MNWGLEDFIAAAALVAGGVLCYTLASRITGNKAYRAAVGIALVGAFILIWVNAAVGIIGSEDNDANLMYFGVLAVGFIAAFIGRFRPRGMAIAMYATAAAQLLVAVIALGWQMGTGGNAWPADVVVATGFFAVLWLVSARLFRRAAQSMDGPVLIPLL